jgi:superfamily II DNA/RNA helicase
MFSATIPKWVKNVAYEFMKKNYKTVDLAENLKNKTSKTVNHLAINCPYSNRISALADLCN